MTEETIQGFYLSQAAFDEFNRQDVFASLEEFIEAMPPATRGVHLYPAEVVEAMEDKEATIASAAGLFSWLTMVHTTPTREDPAIEDGSIFDVRDTNSLLKQQEGDYQRAPSNPENQNTQSMRDEGLQDISLTDYSHGDYDGIPRYLNHHTGPGDSDDYERNNYYRNFDLESGRSDSQNDKMSVLFAVHLVDSNPIVLPSMLFDNTKTAANWGDIVGSLNPDVVSASKDCSVILRKADPKNNRWTFSVRSSGGSGRSHTVHLKVVPFKNVVDVNRLDLKVGCSCEFWKWQGPDHHAHKHGYLDRKKRSDGSVPTVRDPDGFNRVCKHVYAASEKFLSYRIKQKVKSSAPVDNSDFYKNQRIEVRIKRAGVNQPTRTIPSKASLDLRKQALLSEMYQNTEQFTSALVALADKIHNQTRE